MGFGKTIGWMGVLWLGAWMTLAAAEPVRPDRGVLRVGYVEFPPFEYMDASGEAAGSYIDIMRKVGAEAGYRLEFQLLPISRTYLYLQEGRIDVWPGLRDIPLLKGHVLESRAVPIHIDLLAWRLKDTPPLKRLEDLEGHIVILITGYTYAGLLYKLTRDNSGVMTTFTSTHLSALQMLVKRRGHYLLDYREPIGATLLEFPVEDLQHDPVLSQLGAFVVSARAPQAQRIVEELDAAYDRLVSTGQLKPIPPVTDAPVHVQPEPPARTSP